MLSAIPATTETTSDRGNNSQSYNAALLKDLTEFCRSDSLSEGGLHEIIERHGCAPNNNDPSNDYAFFHQACDNERLTEGILRYLLECFPNAVRDTDEGGHLPLHYICRNKNVTLGMVQLLIDAFPTSVRHETNNGCIPHHVLCNNKNMDEVVGLEILKLLLERCPGALRHFSRDGDLPLHIAARYQSPEFCRILAYPGSERLTNGVGALPFHTACALNTVATVKYLYQLYPESINVATNGFYPIHMATAGLNHREYSQETAIEMTQFLLDCDPDVALHQYDGKIPLYWTCYVATNEDTPKLNAHLKITQILYDVHPEAIERNEITSELDSFPQEVQTSANTQLTHARQARDQTVMTTPDEDGQLPLHKTLRDNVTLGSIKLLVKGNPSALRCPDNKRRIPLHIACQYHESAAVVEYLIGLDSIAFRATDFEHNTALHFACRGAKHDTITLLLEKYGGITISKRNAHNQLPIHLLLESDEVSDRDDSKYMESIYRLLRAYPETVIGVKEESKLDDDSHHSGKKNKFGTE